MIKIVSVFGLIILISACSVIDFSVVYKGDSMPGKHTRGLAVNDGIIITSGSKGSFAFYNNLTAKFDDYDWVTGMEDFRDVHINPDGSVLLLNSGTLGDIWQIKNGKQAKFYSKPNLFLDGFSFIDSVGYAYGDPINDSTFFVLKTTNYGQTWSEIKSDVLPKIIDKEAGFAASGTGIQTPEKNVVYIATGVGDTSRIFRSFDGGKSWDVANTPMKSGDDFGIYSMHFSNKNEGFVVGGSYKDTLYNENICFFTTNGGDTWQNRSKGLPGYMSCIDSNLDMSLIVTTGRLGTYYSMNNGENWKLLTKTPYYTCKVTSNQIILAGRYGTFEMMSYKFKK